MENKPYWWPQRVDAAYIARLREDYPEYAGYSDDYLREHFECDQKYATLWDHVGEAYADYEPLADAFLSLVARISTCEVVRIELQDALRDSKGSSIAISRGAAVHLLDLLRSRDQWNG